MDILIMIFLIIIFIIIVIFSLRYYKQNKYYKSEEFRCLLSENFSLKQRYYDIEENYQKLSMQRNKYFKTNTGDGSAGNVVNCSLTICRNAENNPFKYICKYFNIKPDIENIKYFEKEYNLQLSCFNYLNVFNSIQSQIKDKIDETVNKHKFFLTKKQLSKKLHVNNLINKPLIYNYISYSFIYKSPQGKSNKIFTYYLTEQNLLDFISFLQNQLNKQQSAQYQRNLMTKKLRQEILKRDNYTCQCCGLSIYKEPNILLEIDHILPISKGGITEKNNLQTLCWKCNRKKGNKIQ